MAHTGNFALIQTPIMAGLMASHRVAKDAGWMAPALLANEMNARSLCPRQPDKSGIPGISWRFWVSAWQRSPESWNPR